MPTSAHIANAVLMLANESLKLVEHPTEHPHDGGGGEDPHGGGDHEEHHHPQVVVYFCFLTLFLGAITMHLLSRVKCCNIPYTVVLLLEGILLGVLQNLTNPSESLGALNQSMKMWSNINPEVLLYVFLPALLFGECMGLRWHIVRKTVAQCIILASLGVLLGCFMTAAVGYYIFPYDWSIERCLVFGAILSATDPVAVVAILKELGASPKLTMIICGEALLNDGTAIVIFKLFAAMALYKAKDANGNLLHPTAMEDINMADGASAGGIFVFFLRMAIAAAIFGIITGLICSFLCAWASQRTSHDDTTIQIALCIVTAYLTFFLADHVLGMSGVLATVVSGVVVSALSWPIFNSPETMSHVWHMFEYIGNTLIFVLAGLVIGYKVDHALGVINGMDFIWLLVNYVGMNVIRYIMVGLFFPFMKCLGYGLTWREAFIISYGGLRGAVGLSLALIVYLEEWGSSEIDEKYGIQVLFHVGGIAVLTMIVNGTTSSWWLRQLGMTTTDVAKAKITNEIERRVHEHCMEVFDGEVAKLETFSEEQKLKVKNNCSCLRDIAQPASMRTAISRIDFKKSVAVKEFFINAVKTAYAEQTAKGILRHDGPQEMILKSSIEYAIDHLHEENTLRDFEYVEAALEKPHGCASKSWRKILSCITGALSMHEHFSVVAVHDRTCVYLLMCFIQAHKEAQRVVQHYLGDDGELAEQQEQIIELSKKSVRDAQRQLDSKDHDLVRDASVQQMASVVLESQRRFLDNLHDGGVLDDGQHHHLLHDVAHDLAHVRGFERQMKRARDSRQSFEARDSAQAPWKMKSGTMPEGRTPLVDGQDRRTVELTDAGRS